MIEQAANATNVMDVIHPSDLLQVDATVIVGILIFLTITPLLKNVTTQILNKKYILFSMFGTLWFLGLWIILLLLLYPSHSHIDYFFAAKFFTVIGIIALLITVARIIKLIEPPAVDTMQKVPDDDSTKK